MGRYVDIYCLNKRHSKIVCGFLRDLEVIINDATYYDEDFKGFKEVMEKFIFFHNELGISAAIGDVDYENWYLSLPNNVYWATIGYFASVQCKEEDDLDEFKEEVFSLIYRTINKLNRSLIVQPWVENQEKIHLN